MTDFTHTNLKDADDSAAGRGGDIEARFGRKHIDSELRRWDVVRVAPSVVRAFEGGPEGLELIAIGADRAEGGDGEMVKDFWTD